MRSSRPGGSRGSIRLLIPALLVLAAAGASPAVAGGVAAVMSQDLVPYREALQGIIAASGESITVHDLKADPGGEDGVLKAIREQEPDVVLALGARAAQVLTRRLKGVPIVFCMVLGVDVETLAGPWSTGVALEVSPEEQLDAFRKVVPSLSRLAILYDPAKSTATVDKARSAASKRGLQIEARPVTRPADVPDAFRSAAAAADGLWLVPDSTVVSRESFDFILRESVERRLPVMVFSEPMVRAGGLVCVAADNGDIGRQVGDMLRRILKRRGQPLPPVEPPRAPRIVLNLKTAVALSLKVPDEAIAKARQVYR